MEFLRSIKPCTLMVLTRDNRVHYILTHPAELTAVGGLAVVFGTGETHQTSIATDGGQFQSLSGSYLAAPAALP
jgi:hypothetical protein